MCQLSECVVHATRGHSPQPPEVNYIEVLAKVNFLCRLKTEPLVSRGNHFWWLVAVFRAYHARWCLHAPRELLIRVSHDLRTSTLQNVQSGSEVGSYLMLIAFCITQLYA
jgi:hypothetical protein